jgi:hypothetical protein
LIFTGLCFVAAVNSASKNLKWPPRKMVFVVVTGRQQKYEMAAREKLFSVVLHSFGNNIHVLRSLQTRKPYSIP